MTRTNKNARNKSNSDSTNSPAKVAKKRSSKKRSSRRASTTAQTNEVVVEDPSTEPASEPENSDSSACKIETVVMDTKKTNSDSSDSAGQSLVKDSVDTNSSEISSPNPIEHSTDLMASITELLDRHLKLEDCHSELSRNQTLMLDRLVEQDKLLKPVIASHGRNDESDGCSPSPISQLSENVETLSKRSEKLESNLEMAIQLLMEQNELPPNQIPSTGNSGSEFGEKFIHLSDEIEQVATRHARFEEMMTSVLDLMINQHKSVNNGFQSLNDRMAELSNLPVSSNGNPDIDTNKGSKTSSVDGWNAQKADLLAQYGCEVANDESFTEETMAAASNPIVTPQKTPQDEPFEEESTQDESASKTADRALLENEEIAKLREELESKLRTAEIEISIERAKIARMQSELEVKKSEIDQAVKKFEKLNKGSKNKSKNSKMMSRLSKWLPHKSTE